MAPLTEHRLVSGPVVIFTEHTAGVGSRLLLIRRSRPTCPSVASITVTHCHRPEAVRLLETES
jgi:hypothetical protein